MQGKVGGYVDTDLDVEEFESKGGTATYKEMKDYINEKYDFMVSSLNIGQTKKKAGSEKRKNCNPGFGDGKVPTCPPEKEKQSWMIQY